MCLLRYILLCFALAAFSTCVSAQTVEELRCDTATLHALFNASVKETRKKLYGDMGPNLVRVTALPTRSGTEQDSCTRECVTFLEWPRAWTDALGLTTVPLDSAVDQRVFIKRPVFRSAKTCVVPYFITPTEWGGWGGFLEFWKRGQHWRFNRERTTGVSCGSW